MAGEAKPKKSSLSSFVKHVLRQASYKWKPRSEALKLARVDRGRYKCASCEGVFKRDEVHLDHIDPVVPIKEGFTTWDNYINRMYPEVEGFQVVCVLCHKVKTDQEDEMRKFYKKSIDKPKKNKDSK